MSEKPHPIPLVPVTARPEGMTYEAYKELQRQQDRRLKEHKRGRLVFVADGPVQVGTTAEGAPIVARRKQSYRKPQNPTP